MAEVTPIPDTVELCRRELAVLGLRLDAVTPDEAAHGFDLRHIDGTRLETIERFSHLMWTELESAQAAVRFTRYFYDSANSINGETPTKPLSLEDTQG